MKYVDFWAGLDVEEQWFLDQISDKTGTCFSVFGNQYESAAHLPLVFYSAETWGNETRFEACDYSASFHDRPEDDSHLRLPNYVCIYGPEQVKSDIKTRQSELVGDKTACMVASNDNAKARKNLVRALQEEVDVDCGGPVLNNISRVPRGDGARERYQNFHDFARNYKFVVAAENGKERGYTTEKLFNAFRAGAVPIYYGNPDVGDFFNTDALIHCHDFDSFEGVVERVKELDQNPDEYERIRNTPALPDSDIYNTQKIQNFIS